MKYVRKERKTPSLSLFIASTHPHTRIELVIRLSLLCQDRCSSSELIYNQFSILEKGKERVHQIISLNSQNNSIHNCLHLCFSFKMIGFIDGACSGWMVNIGIRYYQACSVTLSVNCCRWQQKYLIGARLLELWAYKRGDARRKDCDLCFAHSPLICTSTTAK